MSNLSPNLKSVNLIELLKRHRKTLLYVPLACILLGALYFILCPRTYRSEARLFLRVGRESVGVDPTASAGQTMQLYTSNREDEVKSTQAIIKSRSVASQVVDRLGPDVVLGRKMSGEPASNIVFSLLHLPLDLVVGAIKSIDPISEHEEAIIKLERNLAILTERQTTVIVVQYKAPTPQMAQEICQAVVEVAQQEQMRVHRSEESTSFFTEQQERLRKQLDDALNALRLAKDEIGLANAEQRRTTLEAKFSAVELEHLAAMQQLATAEARIEKLNRQLAETPERLRTSQRSVPNIGTDMLRDRLFELQVKSMDLESRYSKTHPLVVAVNEQLKEASKVLGKQSEQRSETTDDLNPIHSKLLLSLKQEDSQVAGLKARLAMLDEQKEAVLADVRNINLQDIKIDQLAREAELARSKYMQYAETMEVARIDRELQRNLISNISVAQRATLAEKPVNPSRLLTVAGIFLAAVGGTVGLVFVREQLTVRAESLQPEARSYRLLRRRRSLSKVRGHAEPEQALANVPK